MAAQDEPSTSRFLAAFPFFDASLGDGGENVVVLVTHDGRVFSRPLNRFVGEWRRAFDGPPAHLLSVPPEIPTMPVGALVIVRDLESGATHVGEVCETDSRAIVVGVESTMLGDPMLFAKHEIRRATGRDRYERFEFVGPLTSGARIAAQSESERVAAADRKSARTRAKNDASFGGADV